MAKYEVKPELGEILLNIKDGFVIFLTRSSGRFTGIAENGARYSANSLDELDDMIKKHVAQQRKFNPVEAIHIRRDRTGKITSRDSTSTQYIVFAYQETYSGSTKPHNAHTKECLLTPATYSEKEEFYFVLATPENLKILQEITDLDDQLVKLSKKQEELRKTYTDPVTWAILENQKNKE